MTAPATRVMLAMPTNRGIDFPTVQTLIGCVIALKGRGVGVSLAHLAGGSCDWARAELVGQCLDGDFTHLFFLDCDIAFDAQVLLDLIDADRDIISAPYVLRRQGHGYSFTQLGAGNVTARGTIEVSGVGMGAILIKRHVLEAIGASHPELMIDGVDGATRCAMFNPMIIGPDSQLARECREAYPTDVPLRVGAYASEDISWCIRARACGFQIEVLVSAETTHAGFPCSLRDWPSPAVGR